MNVHSRTPTLSAHDPRGLPVRTVDYCRTEVVEPAQTRINRTLHDVAGRAVAQWDPRLWSLHMSDPLTPANLTSVYLLNGQVLRSDSVDAGMQIALHGVGAHVLFDWDSRGTRRETQHDLMLRPLAVFEEGESQPRLCVERFMYGQPDAADPTRNQLGQLLRHDDPAGSLLFESFSISGQCCENSRHFTLQPGMPDWPEPIDERARLLEPGEGATTRWRFGPQGQVIEQVDARGNRHFSEFTLDGRLRASHLQLKHQTGPQTLVSDIAHNADGQVTQELAGNGVLTALTYRPEDGRLLERSAVKANGTALQLLRYEYDRVGNVLSIEDKALPIRYFANQRIDPISRFTYDSLYQLSEATGWEAGAASQGPESLDRNDPAALSNYRQSYRYDESGNLLELKHVGMRSGRKLKPARCSNRCLPYRNDVPPTEEEIAAAFDPRGNLRTLEAGRSLTWGLRNELQSVTPVERVSGLNDIEQYVYDGGGQRVRKTRSLQTNSRGVVGEVRYLPGLELRSDRSSAAQLQVISAEGGLNSVQVLHWDSAPPTGANDLYRYSHTDHLGSTSLELGEDARIISQETFLPFGETAWSKDTEVSYKTLRYSGKERDATGLYYYGYRYYMPWLQRWLNPDPAGVEADGLNLFRMVRNNPLTFSDEYGEKPVSESAVGTAIDIFESFKENYSDTDRVLPYTMMSEITQGKLKFKTAKASPAVLEKTTPLRFSLRHYSYNRENKGAVPSHMEIKSNFSLVISQKMKLGGKSGNTSEKDWTKAGNMGFTFFLLAINGEVNERRFLAGMTHFAEYDLEDDRGLKEAFGDSFDSLEFFASPDVLDPKHSSDMSAVPMIKGRLKELKAVLLGNSGISPVQVGRMNSRTMLDSLDKSFHGTLEIKIPGAVKVGKWHSKATTVNRNVA
ncbi:RHS repeat protein [Pseudomonas sp. NIBR-H-19]|uniref:RHS repeat-associated core domain-containing protein n=1 Tax=Pseudomonas sp. NIBR-H-19 TaxID=2901380 RepID=UPI001E520A38|nr:RHS repeat-associated core domain-containing protein [Pseudomonas sp. NIBR-H-19]UHC79901.1 RHS repeat protein [Pseudomonas sp. NIBR-H-19]